MRELRAERQGQERQAVLELQRSRMRELRAERQGQERQAVLERQRSRMRELRAERQRQERQAVLERHLILRLIPSPLHCIVNDVMHD